MINTDQLFQIEAETRWAEMDQNGHTRNSAYLDLASHCRICFFDAMGFDAKTFAERRFGPVVFKDEMTYRRETFLGERLKVSLLLAGLSPKGFRFSFRNEFHTQDDTLAVIVQSHAGWLDLDKRRLIDPPADLLKLLRSLKRAESFQVLEDRNQS